MDPGTEEILGRLTPGLALTDEQVDHVRELLRNREQRLREWHAALRTSKVFNVREYGRTLTRLTEDWYRGIDQVLDTAQHDRFEAIAGEGLLGRGTEFVIDLNEMVVLR